MGLLWCNSSFAEIKLLDQKNVAVLPTTMFVATVCIDGYQYVTLSDTMQEDNSNALTGSITQSFEIIDGKSLPKKCK